MSVDFSGTANQIGFDDITLGSATPGMSGSPEPCTSALMGTGLLGALFYSVRKRHASSQNAL
jgi:hypothetical protein